MHVRGAPLSPDLEGRRRCDVMRGEWMKKKSTKHASSRLAGGDWKGSSFRAIFWSQLVQGAFLRGARGQGAFRVDLPVLLHVALSAVCSPAPAPFPFWWWTWRFVFPLDFPTCGSKLLIYTILDWRPKMCLVLVTWWNLAWELVHVCSSAASCFNL